MDTEPDTSFTTMEFDPEDSLGTSSPRGGYVQWQSSQIRGLPRNDGQIAFRTERPRVSALLSSPYSRSPSSTSSSGSIHPTLNTLGSTGKPRRRPQTSNNPDTPNPSSLAQLVGAFKVVSDKLEARVVRGDQCQEVRPHKRSTQSGPSSHIKHEGYASSDHPIPRRSSALTTGSRKGKEKAHDVEMGDYRPARPPMTSDRTWPSISDSTDSSMEVDDSPVPKRAATLPSVLSKDYMQMPPPPVPPKISAPVFNSGPVVSKSFLPVPQSAFPKIESKPPTFSPLLHPVLQSNTAKSQSHAEPSTAVRFPEKPPLQPQKQRKSSPLPQLGVPRPGTGLPALGMRRTHTVPQASTSSTMLPTKQKSFRPPLLSQCPPSQQLQKSTSFKRSLSPELLPPPPVSAEVAALVARATQSQPSKSQSRPTKPLPARKMSEPPPAIKAPTPSPPSLSNGSATSSASSSRLTRHSSDNSSTTTVTSAEDEDDSNEDDPGSPDLVPQHRSSSPASSYGDISYDHEMWLATLEKFD